MKRVAIAFATLVVLAGCAAESDPGSTVTTKPATGENSPDEGTQATPDPTGGRAPDPASCFAACQNSGFTCIAKGAPPSAQAAVELTPEAEGCSGTLTPNSTAVGENAVKLVLDCRNGKVCWGTTPGADATTCQSATFSAFNFAYVAKTGAAQEICTRN